MSRVRIEVDGSFCEGTGYCVRICPGVFQVDPISRKVIVLKPLLDDLSVIEKAELAETTCPTRAILLTQVDDT